MEKGSYTKLIKTRCKLDFFTFHRGADTLQRTIILLWYARKKSFNYELQTFRNVRIVTFGSSSFSSNNMPRNNISAFAQLSPLQLQYSISGSVQSRYVFIECVTPEWVITSCWTFVLLRYSISCWQNRFIQFWNCLVIDMHLFQRGRQLRSDSGHEGDSQLHRPSRMEATSNLQVFLWDRRRVLPFWRTDLRHEIRLLDVWWFSSEFLRFVALLWSMQLVSTDSFNQSSLLL